MMNTNCYSFLCKSNTSYHKNYNSPNLVHLEQHNNQDCKPHNLNLHNPINN